MTTVHRELLGSSLAAGFTASLFSPIECVKTRLQVQEYLAVSAGQKPLLYRGFIHAVSKIAAEDGLVLFWQHGFVGFVGRDLFYSGIRIGAYPTVRKLYAGDTAMEEISLITKIAAGMSTGAFGSVLANPFDVLRVRHCTEGGRSSTSSGRYETGLHKGQRPTFTSSLDLIQGIYRNEGIRAGLWKGASATMTRAAFLSGSQLASYDHSKTYIKKVGLMEEGTTLHLLCATFSGLVATTCCNPPDVVKSRLMLARASRAGAVVGPLEVVASIFKESGVRGFFRGWTAAYARAGPAYFIQMPITEMLRRFLNVEAI